MRTSKKGSKQPAGRARSSPPAVEPPPREAEKKQPTPTLLCGSNTTDKRIYTICIYRVKP